MVHFNAHKIPSIDPTLSPWIHPHPKILPFLHRYSNECVSFKFSISILYACLMSHNVSFMSCALHLLYFIILTVCVRAGIAQAAERLVTGWMTEVSN
jgi:hypothetical protein